jgi:hypothetical protein
MILVGFKVGTAIIPRIPQSSSGWISNLPQALQPAEPIIRDFVV